MLKVRVVEPVAELRLVQYGNEVYVEDVNSGYNIVGFKVVDGKVRLLRYTSVIDDNYATDDNGCVITEEV
jgi:hypothetical protein